MGSFNFTEAFIAFLILGIIVAFVGYGLVDLLFISDDVITKTPLIPQIKETCINGVCDTVYIYKNIK